MVQTWGRRGHEQRSDNLLLVHEVSSEFGHMQDAHYPGENSCHFRAPFTIAMGKMFNELSLISHFSLIEASQGVCIDPFCT